MSKKNTKTDNEVGSGLEEAAEETTPAAPTGKRQLGVKEPIIFKWKLVGDADGYFLTLFKAVERSEVEGQLERLQKEGYYQNLRILDIDEKIVQRIPPPEPKKAASKAADKAGKRTARKGPAAKRARTTTAKASRLKKPSRSIARKVRKAPTPPKRKKK